MSDYGSEIYGDNNVEEVFGDDGKDVYGDFQNETLIFGETFDDTQKQTLTEGLNARSQKDKHSSQATQWKQLCSISARKTSGYRLG